jgi:hypothetical protein
MTLRAWPPDGATLMSDPKSPKYEVRPGPAPATRAGTPSPRPSVPSRAGAPLPAARSGGEGATGKVVHDDRGNAVWDWVKQTGRHAIESTTRMLRKLEAPELKFEDTKDEELRVMPEPSTGGGYDPYNQATKPGRTGFKK